MNLKLALALTTLTLTLLSTPALAREDKATSTRAAARQEKLDARSSNLKSRGVAEIDRRITALNKLITRLNDLKRLTQTQKDSFTTQVQVEIDSLTALKAKIQADTDVETLRTDVKSIVQDYRVFGLFMPQMSIVINADKILNLVDSSTALTSRLQARIATANALSLDTTALQDLLDERVEKLADAKTQAENAINAVLPLTPQGFPDNLDTLKSARDMLKLARSDLTTAVKNAQTIRQGLK